MSALQSLRSWAEQHNIDYTVKITMDNEWVVAQFDQESTYTLFAVTYKYTEFEYHICT